jgi:RNA polymerase sigma-70 factor (ECF subfamily)
MLLNNHINQDIFLSFQQGDEKAFTWFFRELHPLLSFYAFKLTKDREASEEIASEAFIKIWHKHERFSDPFAIKAYLYRIVRNDSFKHLAKQKRSLSSRKELAYLYESEQQKDAFRSLVAAETSHQLLKALDTLPKECSKVFQLLYIEEKSIKETAQLLRLSQSTVKTQKARGLATLRKSLRWSPMIIIAATILFFTPC